MNGPFTPLRHIDLLTEAVAYVRPRLEGNSSIGDKLRTLWAAVVAARDFGADDIIEDEFLNLARDAGPPAISGAVLMLISAT